MAIRKNKNSGVPAKATKAVAAKPKTGEKKKGSHRKRVPDDDEALQQEAFDVAEGAEVSYSVLLRGCTVESGAVVRYAILGEGCHIGKDCRVGAAPEECDPDNWGLTVLAPGCSLEAGRNVPAKTMLNRDGEEVSR